MSIKYDEISKIATYILNFFKNIRMISMCIAAQNSQDKNSLSSNDAYSTTTLQHVNPPFKPGFFVLKVRINETLVTKFPRTIRLGMCLPPACSLDDVERMAQLADDEVASRHHIDIISVRSPTENDYVFWKDRAFIILV